MVVGGAMHIKHSKSYSDQLKGWLDQPLILITLFCTLVRIFPYITRHYIPRMAIDVHFNY